MRLTRLVACLVLLVVSFVSGQWLETRILLPDSLGSLYGPQSLVYNAVNNKVYVGCDSGVLVVDGATNQRLARILTGGEVVALCHNPTSNKVYCTNHRSSSVTVMDGVTNSVIATVRAGRWPRALCYNLQNNKVYCANSGSNNVTVIDGVTNGVAATVATGACPLALCYNPTDN